MSRLKIGIRLESLGLPLRRALAEASKLGVAGVQLDAAGDLSPQSLAQTGRRELRHLLRSHNLDLTALGCPLRRGFDAAEDQQQRLELVRNVMTLAYDLGPRVVIVQAGKLPEPVAAQEKPEAKPSSGLLAGTAGMLALDPGALGVGRAGAQDDESKRGRRFTEALRDLAAHGDRIGVTLALETGLEDGQALDAFLSRLDTGALGANLDPANLLLHGFDPYGSARALNRRVVHAHARDARQSSASRTVQEVPLGHGDIDWMLFLAVLEEIEYRGWLVIERESGDSRLADVAAGVAFLRRLTG